MGHAAMAGGRGGPDSGRVVAALRMVMVSVTVSVSVSMMVLLVVALVPLDARAADAGTGHAGNAAAGSDRAENTGAARFGALDALVGRWQGYVEPADRSPHGVIERTYRYVLDGMFLQAESVVMFSPERAGTEFDLDHELELISYDTRGERFVARRFVSQGIVSEETVTLGAASGLAVYASDALVNAASGMRTRRTLTLEDGERLREVFEIEMPGIGFRTYQTVHLRRAGE